MKNIDNSKILEKTRTKISISNYIREENNMQKRKNIFKTFAASVLMISSCTSMVFAKDISNKIYENVFLTGKGTEIAINNGYIENTEMQAKESAISTTMKNEEDGKQIEDVDTKIKIDDFIMDDYNLSLTINVELSEKVKEIISPEDIWEMNFPDLVITDENNTVINETTGLNSFIQNRGENPLKVTYNIYTDKNWKFPKAQKLNFSFKTIKISKSDETKYGDEEITLNGSWSFTVDVPEKMYNRKQITYKQISTTNSDFNVLTASTYETGTNIKLKFKAQKHLEKPTTPELEFWKTLDKDDELKTVDIYNYLFKKLCYTDEYIEYSNAEFEIWKFDKYIVNENGDRFDMSEGPNFNGSGYIDDDGIYESTCTFDLTQYDMTDRITLYVDYHGNKAEIVLEKVGD